MSIFCFKDRDSNLWLTRRVDLSLELFAKYFFFAFRSYGRTVPTGPFIVRWNRVACSGQ